MRFFLIILVFFMLSSCESDVAEPKATPAPQKKLESKLPVQTYEIVKVYRHDKNAFTQGLVFHKGFLYESTGQRGRSTLRKVELKTGKVLQKHKLKSQYFGEGMTILDDKIYQITWQSEVGFIYDLETFKVLKEFRYRGEGWGLTHIGKTLFLSDGTHIIRKFNPETFEQIGHIAVNGENGNPLIEINELEYIKGEIWANVWHTQKIARINPESGKLLGWINLEGISPQDIKGGDENTLNGIAYDAENDRIFVTGKNWKKLFEIKLKPQK